MIYEGKFVTSHFNGTSSILKWKGSLMCLTVFFYRLWSAKQFAFIYGDVQNNSVTGLLLAGSVLTTD